MILWTKNSLFGANPANSQPVARVEQLSGLEILETCLQTTFSPHLFLGLTWSCSPIYPHTSRGKGCFTSPTKHLLDHKLSYDQRTTLFSILKGSRHLEVCASTVSCGAHAGSGRHGKGGMTATLTVLTAAGGPDLTRHAHTGHGSDVVDELTDSQETGVIAVLGWQITAQETRAAASQTLLWSQAKKTWPRP